MLFYRKKLSVQLQRVFIIFFIISIPFSLKINSICLVIIVVLFLISGDLREKLEAVKKNKLALLLIGFYMLHIIGALYSDNLTTAFSKLERKVSFILFPVIFASYKAIPQQFYRTIFKTFVVTTAIACSICLLHSVFTLFFSPEKKFLFYHDYSAILDLHAIYLSIYALLSICFILYLLQSADDRKTKAVYIGLMLFLIINIFILTSKLIIGLLFIIVNIAFAQRYIKNITLGKVFVYALVINVGLIILLYNIPIVNERFTDVVTSNMEVLTKERFAYDTPFSGLTLRLLFWKSVLQVLNEQGAWLFGVGIGDGQNFLDQVYKKINIYTGDPTRGDTGYLGYDPHSQYFSTLLVLGLTGLLYFIVIIIAPFIVNGKQSNLLYPCFIFIIAGTALSESILELQKGIVVFSFFYSLLAINSGAFLKDGQHKQ